MFPAAWGAAEAAEAAAAAWLQVPNAALRAALGPRRAPADAAALLPSGPLGPAVPARSYAVVGKGAARMGAEAPRPLPWAAFACSFGGAVPASPQRHTEVLLSGFHRRDVLDRVALAVVRRVSTVACDDGRGSAGSE